MTRDGIVEVPELTPTELAESVRTRPALYFGSTQAYGAFTWLTYVLSDAIAEYEAGHSTFLYVRLVHGGRFELIDDGRPLRSRGWKVFVGGPSQISELGWAAAACASADYRRQKRANCLTLRLDPKVIDASGLCCESVTHYLRDQAALSPGWLVMLKDKRTAPKIKHMFHYPNGLQDLLPSLRYAWEQESSVFAGTENGIAVHGAVAPAPCDFGIQVMSYVNRERTSAGGAHVDGIRVGLSRARLSERALLYGRDFQDLVGALAVTLEEPRYCGSTRDRLAGDDVTEAVATVVARSLS